MIGVPCRLCKSTNEQLYFVSGALQLVEPKALVGCLFIYYEYKKLHSLQSLLRTTRKTKTTNITKDDVTSASRLT